MFHYNLNLCYVGDDEIEDLFMCLPVFYVPSFAKYILKTFVWYSKVVFLLRVYRHNYI